MPVLLGRHWGLLVAPLVLTFPWIRNQEELLPGSASGALPACGAPLCQRPLPGPCPCCTPSQADRVRSPWEGPQEVKQGLWVHQAIACLQGALPWPCWRVVLLGCHRTGQAQGTLGTCGLHAVTAGWIFCLNEHTRGCNTVPEGEAGPCGV